MLHSTQFCVFVKDISVYFLGYSELNNLKFESVIECTVDSVCRRIIRHHFYHDDKIDVFLPATITQQQYGQLFDIIFQNLFQPVKGNTF